MKSKVEPEKTEVPRPSVGPPPPTGTPTAGAPQNQWMQPPPTVRGCPPGLEYLTQLDQLLVHQQIEMLEAFTGFETKNKFAIKNSLGQQCYYCYEESNTCQRLCCGSHRGFIFHVVNNMNQEVLRLVREFKCCAGCCWCANSEGYAYSIRVETPTGEKIGTVRQTGSCWKPRYDILDGNDQIALKVKGPCCICQGICCTCEIPFDVMSTDGTPLGSIAKQWSGFTKEAFTNATNFGLTFPKDLDVKIKAVLMATTFLIDMMFFEQNK